MARVNGQQEQREPLPEEEWNRRTFLLELARSLPAGVIETMATTFAVFLAVSVFQASQLEKAFLVASSSIGLLLSLFVVQWVRKLGCSVNQAIGAVSLLAAVGFSVAAIFPHSLACYLGGMMMAKMGVMLGVPLFSQIYRKCFPSESRGQLFAIAAILRKVAAIVAALFFGFWLKEHPNDFPSLLALYAVSCVAMVVCVAAMKPVRLRRNVGAVNLFSAFGHVKRDRAFRRVLTSWMILGLGNLICLHIFVDTVSNPRFGLALDVAQVSLITTIAPEICYLLTVFLWGRIFDRVNFFAVRIMINLFFIVGILVFFLGGQIWTLYLGMGLHGIGKAGGNIAWSLWVTKFAEEDQVAEYMSVHTFFTGCRSLAAPFIGFSVAGAFSPQVVGILGATLITVSTVMILPMLLENRTKRLVRG